jgi:hypothetical protein
MMMQAELIKAEYAGGNLGTKERDPEEEIPECKQLISDGIESSVFRILTRNQIMSHYSYRVLCYPMLAHSYLQLLSEFSEERRPCQVSLIERVAKFS